MHSKERLLIVDDDEGTRRSLSLILGKKGYETETAATGREAIEKAQRRFFDVGLLDVRLPDMEGTQLVSPLKGMHPDMAVILVTAFASAETPVQALNEEAWAYITKPLNMDAVLATVREALEKQRLIMESRRLYEAAQRELAERKRAEEERRRLQQELAQAQKMQAVGTLAAGIAHEFNNIHGAIIGFADLTLRTEKLSSSARENLAAIVRSAVRGAELTERLLAFSTARQRHRKTIRLTNVVDEVVTVLQKQMESDGIELAVRHSTKTPRVAGDAALLEQVVMNLIANARHAMLGSQVKKLTLRTGSQMGTAFIRVADTGCGIPRENLPRIFEPFFTTKGSLAGGGAYDGKIHGTGLGLSVCHNIVKSHGGETAFKSHVGKGTTFTVYLPAASRRRPAKS
jgi:signal transduction histidine kinase